jgi:uncharacterized SAM-binding protein YcdF (DUF218 family)
LKIIGRVASIGVIAALILSAGLAKWMQVEDERELADQTAPWIVYFVGFLVCALIALGVILAVWLFARLALRNRGNHYPDA